MVPRLLARAALLGCLLLLVGCGAPAPPPRAGGAEQEAPAMTRPLYEAFAEIDQQTYGGFWQCLYRERRTQVFALPSPNVLREKVARAYDANRGTYRAHLDGQCLPLLREVARRIRALKAPPGSAPALERYARSAEQVGQALAALADGLELLYQTTRRDKQVLLAADEWHKEYRPDDKKLPPAVIAYDHFLRCAVAGFDELKDADAVAEELRKHYGTPRRYVGLLRSECMKLMDAPPKRLTPNYLAGLRKFEREHAEPRDLQAFLDFFKRANLQHLAEIMEPLVKALGEYRESREEVLGVARRAGIEAPSTAPAPN